jgi:two-component system, LytTR family, response regulator
MEPKRCDSGHLHQPGLLLLSTNTGMQVIDINAIIRIQSISNYSKLFFSNGKTLVVAKVLKWFEESLSVNQFIRVHRTHLLNKNFIYQYSNKRGGKVKLANGDWIDVSRRKKTFVRQCLYSPAA